MIGMFAMSNRGRGCPIVNAELCRMRATAGRRRALLLRPVRQGFKTISTFFGMCRTQGVARVTGNLDSTGRGTHADST